MLPQGHELVTEGGVHIFRVPLAHAEAIVDVLAAEKNPELILRFYPAQFTGTDPGIALMWKLRRRAAQDFLKNLKGVVLPHTRTHNASVISFEVHRDVQPVIYFTENDVLTLIRAIEEALTVSRGLKDKTNR